MSENKIVVTVGVPTYKRPHLLERALESLARQSFPELQVIVADNASPGCLNEEVIQRFKGRINNLEYYKHSSNIGAKNNFFFLLDKSEGRYFMWLADDDEISADFITCLVSMLDACPEAATAAGRWKYMTSPKTGFIMPLREYASSWWYFRTIKYVWHANDDFFYGLHRTDFLRKANFSGYSWPNRCELINWAYVFLLDLILQGKVLVTNDAQIQFINHDYTSKNYDSQTAQSFSGLLKLILRRINVHMLYWRKVANFGGVLYVAPLLAVSAAALVREIGVRVFNRIGKINDNQHTDKIQ